MKIIPILLVLITLFGCQGKSSTDTKASGDQQPAASAALPAGAEGNKAGTDQALPHPAPSNAPADTGAIKVKKAEGAEGKTVAEIFSAKASLKDKPVALRGKVVKFNSGILGKNWLHLRDGSGSPEKNDFDLTVTTTDAAAVGDVVLVQGRVRLDRDFGAGYTYPVIIEDAKVTK